MSELDADSSILVLFCRRPRAGIGKGRIAKDVGEETALAISTRLLDAAVEDASAWPGPVVIAPAEAADAEWAGQLLAQKARVIPQGDGNLGQRIEAIDTTLRQQGGRQIVFIGSDAPALDAAYFAAARRILRHHSVVLGPATDGGVTLMAANRPWPDLEPLPWGTEKLGAALETACRLAGIDIGLLPAAYDIDQIADLEQLRIDLRDDTRPARKRLLEWIDSIELSAPPEAGQNFA